MNAKPEDRDRGGRLDLSDAGNSDAEPDEDKTPTELMKDLPCQFDFEEAPTPPEDEPAATAPESTPESLPTQIMPGGMPDPMTPGGMPTQIMPGGMPTQIMPGGMPTQIMPGGMPTQVMPGAMPTQMMPGGMPTQMMPGALPTQLTAPAPTGLRDLRPPAPVSAPFAVALAGIIDTFGKVSDVNITPGRRPQVEVNGELQEVELGSLGAVLTPENTLAIASEIIGNDPRLLEILESTGAADCAYSVESGSRFRVNIFRSRGVHSIVLRVLANEVPTLESLNVPPILGEIPKLLNGMVLVTGATGTGKSTTLAAIVDRINATRPVHVITLEDPIEFVHPHKLGTVNQRELGSDYFDYADGLRAALRQSPKVILVGEMRDRETIEIGLKAAETGHLVLSTLHTVDAGQTISRITGMFENEERSLARSRLTEVLQYVVSQRLLPREDEGRIAAFEIMGSSLRSRELIQHGETAEKTFYQVISETKPHGWQTFDQHILEMYQAGVITEETAMTYCSERSIVSREIDRIRNSRGEATSELGDLEMAAPTRRRKS